MASIDPFDIEVIYADSGCAIVKVYRIAAPTTVTQLLALAAADIDFSRVDVRAAAVGIFGQVVPGSRPLQPGDRIELYPGPAVDAKEARRQRARRARGR